MKKSTGLFLALVSAVAVWAATEGTVVVDTTLRARKEPSVKSPVLMKLKNGAKVSIVSRCSEHWLEIAAPQDAPVYVDEAFVVGGKVSRDIRMFTGKGREFPSWGELKKGESVTLLDDRARGWVRIAPPERLRLYVVDLYVEGAEDVKMTEKPEEKPEAKTTDKPENTPQAVPAAVPAAKAETKPAAKPAVKAETKPVALAAKPVAPAAKPEAKAETKPAAKPAVKAETKPAAKPVAKPAAPAAKPAAKAETKPAVKPAAKPAAPATKPAAKAETKPAVKPAVKAETKPAAKPAAPAAKPAAPAAKPAAKPLAPVKPDAALQALNIKATDKGRIVKRTGILCETTDGVKAAKFLLLNDRDENVGFVYYPGKEALLKKLVDEKITIQGTEFRVPGWKNTVVVIQSLVRSK